jgi:hypothetical protein
LPIAYCLLLIAYCLLPIHQFADYSPPGFVFLKTEIYDAA